MMLPLLAFVFGSLVIAGAALVLMPKPAAAIDRRLEELASPRSDDETERKPRLQSLIAFFKRIGEKAPHSTKETLPPSPPIPL